MNSEPTPKEFAIHMEGEPLKTLCGSARWSWLTDIPAKVTCLDCIVKLQEAGMIAKPDLSK